MFPTGHLPQRTAGGEALGGAKCAVPEQSHWRRRGVPRSANHFEAAAPGHAVYITSETHQHDSVAAAAAVAVASGHIEANEHSAVIGVSVVVIAVTIVAIVAGRAVDGFKSHQFAGLPHRRLDNSNACESCA